MRTGNEYSHSVTETAVCGNLCDVTDTIHIGPTKFPVVELLPQC